MPAAERPSGFTLIELLVVMAIAGLLLAVTPPLIANAMPGIQLKGTVRQVAAGLRMTRQRAISHREEAVLAVDVERRTVRVAGRPAPIHVSDDLKITLETAAREQEDANRGAIRFFPDGSSTGGRISLSYGGTGYRVDVGWLTGRVRVSGPESPDA